MVPNNPNLRSLEWTPGKSFGPFHFGEPMPDDVDRYRFQGQPDFDADPWEEVQYDSVEAGFTVIADRGLVARIAIWKAIYFGGVNLIGLPINDLVHRLDPGFEGPFERDDDSWNLTSANMGLVVWTNDGLIDYVTVQNPYEWAWSPNESVGPFRFGYPLPSDTDLILRMNDSNSDEEFIATDVVMRSCTVYTRRSDGKIDNIDARGSLTYRGKQLIGRPIVEAKEIVGGEWIEPYPDMLPIIRNEELGISISKLDEDSVLVGWATLDKSDMND